MISYIKELQRLEIQLEAIKSATNNFADENLIGKGGFGNVYKGELVDSCQAMTTTVAVKRLHRSFGQGDVEFRKEVMMLSLHKHDNIISLLGFHDGNDEKIIVYEYAPNGSLDSHLEDQDLTWIQRLEICIGAARGLEYLHRPTSYHQRVLHRDIKSSNMLLDKNWNAKISDFGLSKFGPANQEYTFVLSNAVGTLGYCDPLYVETGYLTKESDVYSFGVVLFEVLCGRLNNKQNRRPLTGLVREHYDSGNMMEIVYDKIKDEMHPDSLNVFTTLAYQCLKREREERPLMKEIVTALEFALGNQTMQRDSSYSRLGSARMMTPSINKDWYRNYYKPLDHGLGGNHHYKGESSMEASRTTTSSRDEASISVSNDSDIESEWIEEDEPGVYITIRQLTDGTRELRRVRFSREKFGEVNAKQWWEENRERIQVQYL